MFGLLINPIVNVLNIADRIVSGEAPTKTQVAQLVDDGVTIAVIASTFGVAEDVITNLLRD